RAGARRARARRRARRRRPTTTATPGSGSPRAGEWPASSPRPQAKARIYRGWTAWPPSFLPPRYERAGPWPTFWRMVRETMSAPAYLIDGLRSPFGRYGGGLAGVRADDLAAAVIAALLERTKIPAERVDDVVLGCANQAGEDNRNVARMALLLAGMPVSVS